MTRVTNSFSDARGLTLNTICRAASFTRFGVEPPQRTENDGAKSWIARGANFVVALSRVSAGARIIQEGLPDESMLLLSPAVPVIVSASGETQEIDEEALVIMPPGSATITARAAGTLVRIFSSRAIEFVGQAVNSDEYRYVNDVAPLVDWPAPVDGFRLRVYHLRNFSNDVGFGRLFRSTNLMVNVLEPTAGPRDTRRLSPHDHPDFEQGSLTLEGEFVHYLRTPWGRDSSLWRADQKLVCSGETLLVIPPRMIHTTSWSTSGARLVDIFAPPRDDFSKKPGWVRNAADYPMPARLDAAHPSGSG